MASCSACGSPLVGDETYCLQCGTRLVPEPEPRPRWAVPVAIVVSIVVLAGVILLIALKHVESDAERKAESPAQIIEQPLGTQTDKLPPGVAAWPADVAAYTVVLETVRDEAEARDRASAAASAGVPVGLLNSSDYRSLPPGRWVLFTGRFDSREAARSAASRYADSQFPRARAAFVGRPAATG